MAGGGPADRRRRTAARLLDPARTALSRVRNRSARGRGAAPAARLRALVTATRAPFLQTIQDLSVRRMAVGRIALVGDAAFIPRPHTAASTAKAAGNALALVDGLKRETDIPTALLAWEPDQIQFGLHLRQGKLLGDLSQKRYPEPRST
jgi:2-polyprenyl-6-methoxyphenol hydroxylase-like FAD-dependent oxidoreductase